ncbi:MAG: glycosyltransferase [Actinobacteria bacterium]|nr:glycosyltransferase [Actinomycetota bacterium]
MRIAYLVNQYPSISVTFVRREIAALEARGVEVVRFAIRDTGGDYPDVRDREEYARTWAILGRGRTRRAAAATLATGLRHPARFVRALRTAVSVWRNSRRALLVHLAYVAEACVLLRWVTSARVEHVHVHFGTNGAIVAMLARELGAPPFSVTVHGSDEFERPREVALSLQAERAAFVVAVSEHARSQILRWAPPAAWSKVHVVRCGLDESFTLSEAPPPPRGRRVTCVGRLGAEKGHRILIEAAQILERGGIGFELACLGDGPERKALEELIAAGDLGERVRLTGWVDGESVRRAIASSRAVVLPSFSESLPVVLMEALALGRPVIATRTGGVAELVEPGINGWLVDAGNAEQLATALGEALSASEEHLSDLGRTGRRIVLERHDGARQAEALLALFRAHIGEGSRAARGERRAESFEVGTRKEPKRVPRDVANGCDTVGTVSLFRRIVVRGRLMP